MTIFLKDKLLLLYMLYYIGPTKQDRAVLHTFLSPCQFEIWIQITDGATDKDVQLIAKTRQDSTIRSQYRLYIYKFYKSNV